MKRCSKCGRVYQDSLNFCTSCGVELEKVVEYDIFGEELNTKNENIEIVDEFGREIEDSYLKVNKIHEILALVSIACAFVPFFGLVEIIASIIVNIKHYKKYKNGLGFLILSFLMLIINIAWTVLLIIYGVFDDLYGDITPSNPSESDPKPTTIEI